MHRVLHQGNCSPSMSGHSSPSLDLVMSNQKANMIKELRWRFQSTQLIIIKQSLTAPTTFSQQWKYVNSMLDLPVKSFYF